MEKIRFILIPTNSRYVRVELGNGDKLKLSINDAETILKNYLSNRPFNIHNAEWIELI